MWFSKQHKETHETRWNAEIQITYKIKDQSNITLGINIQQSFFHFMNFGFSHSRRKSMQLTIGVWNANIIHVNQHKVTNPTTA